MNYEVLKKIIISLLLILLLICIIILALTPSLELKGSKNIEIAYKGKYIDPGYKASFLGEDYSNKVVVSGYINTKKLGQYKITYRVSNSFFTNKVSRILKVVDKEKPTIRLIGADTVILCPNEKYKEKGFTALDNYDKNITKKVKIKKTKDKIIYTVNDTSKNQTKVVRNLIYQDNEAPEIIFENTSGEYIMQGDTYNYKNFKAEDNCDGDVTNKVEIKGNVDTSKPNKYTLKYIVSDSSGNKRTIKKTITVKNKNLYSAYGCGIKNAIFLTFDDGPASNTTNEILDILKEENIKATFFVTNNGDDNIIKREYNEGHAIGLHTGTHKYSEIYSSVQNYFNDIETVSKRVDKIIGIKPKIIRFPGGSSNTISAKYQTGIMTTLTSEVINRGYKYYDWNVDSEDAGKCAKKDENCIYESVINNLNKERCNMILMHDTKEITVKALKNIIVYGKTNGYSFYKIETNTPTVKHKINN